MSIVCALDALTGWTPSVRDSLIPQPSSVSQIWDSTTGDLRKAIKDWDAIDFYDDPRSLNPRISKDPATRHILSNVFPDVPLFMSSTMILASLIIVHDATFVLIHYCLSGVHVHKE